MLLKGTRPVNERSVSYLTATFLDKNNVPAIPASARYRIDDITGKETEILDWTALELSAVFHEVTVTAEQNRILNTRHKREHRQVTVEATGSDGEPFAEVFEYEVINRAGTT
jgi:hypothetical protein